MSMLEFRRALSVSGVATLFDWLWTTRGSLTEKTIRGGVWLTVGEATGRLAGIAKLAVLARLIAPSEFGLFGAAAMVVQLVEYFTDAAFRVALIRKQGDLEDYLGTVWTVQMVRGAAMSLFVYALAPLGAAFFDLPAAVPVVRVLSVIPFLRSLSNPAVVHLRRDLNFRKEVVWKMSGPLAGLAAALVAAAITPSVWALAVSLLASGTVETATSFLVSPFIPRPAFQWARIRELTGFVKWVFWSNVINYFETYLDSAVIGRALGARELGIYQVAMQSSSMPASQIGMQIGGAAYPALSKLNEARDVSRAFLRMTTLLVAVVLPLGCALTAMAPQFCAVVLGARWTEAVPVIRVIVWCGVAIAGIRTSQAVFLALGRPDVNAKVSFLRLGVMMALIYPLLSRFGVAGAAAAVASSAIAALAAQTLVLKRALGLRAGDLLGVMKEGMLASAPVAAAGVAGSSTAPAALLVCGAAILSTGAILAWRLPPYLRSASRVSSG